jgi:phasin family protein
LQEHISDVAVQHNLKGEDQMASKTSPQNGAESIDAALFPGAEAMKTGFDKAAKGYDQFLSFGKDNADALLKSVNEAGRSIETIHAEVMSYARKSVEDGMGVAKAVLAAKTVEEAIRLQGEFGKAAFESYVDQMTKFGDMAVAAAKQAVQPIQARSSAFADLTRTA